VADVIDLATRVAAVMPASEPVPGLAEEAARDSSGISRAAARLQAALASRQARG
jgi:hypothetical protein